MESIHEVPGSTPPRPAPVALWEPPGVGSPQLTPLLPLLDAGGIWPPFHNFLQHYLVKRQPGARCTHVLGGTVPMRPCSQQPRAQRTDHEATLGFDAGERVTSRVPSYFGEGKHLLQLNTALPGHSLFWLHPLHPDQLRVICSRRLLPPYSQPSSPTRAPGKTPGRLWSPRKHHHPILPPPQPHSPMHESKSDVEAASAMGSSPPTGSACSTQARSLTHCLQGKHWGSQALQGSFFCQHHEGFGG